VTAPARRPIAGLDVRQRAAERLAGVIAGTPLEPIVAGEIADPRDRALGNRLVTTAVRRHGQISVVLDEMLKTGLPENAGLFEAALRIGITQLLYLPERGDHSAIHLAVETIKADEQARRYAALGNGVLRNVQRRRGGLVLPNSALVPEWLAERWRKTYGFAGLPKLIEALVEGAVLDLSVQPEGVATVEKFGGTKTLATSYRVARPPAPVSELPGFADGTWWVQDTAAAIPARLLRVQPGHLVADLCAAPGGKTAQLAAAGASVVAVDTDAERMGRLAENLDRLGLQATVRTAIEDAARYGEDGQFDRVLLDAPCTGTGVFRRHPEVIWQRTAADIVDRVKLQARLLDNAARITARDGVIVYCVCSLEPEEGEAQAALFVERHPHFVPVPIEPDELDGWTAPITEAGNLRTVPGLKVRGEAEGTLDGFFAARFLRVG